MVVYADRYDTDLNRLNNIYSKHTGLSLKQISDMLERDKFLNPEEAKKLGLIDEIVEKR